MLDAGGKLAFRFTTSDAATLWLSPLSANFAAHVEVRSAAGWQVYAADSSDTANTANTANTAPRAIKLPAAGSYILELRDVSSELAARQLRFALSETDALGEAARLLPDTLTSGKPVRWPRRRQLSLQHPRRRTLSSSTATRAPASALRWRLLSADGVQQADGDARSHGSPLAMTAGEYLLLIDGAADSAHDRPYAFTCARHASYCQ
jgi:hypothetical protein